MIASVIFERENNTRHNTSEKSYKSYTYYAVSIQGTLIYAYMSQLLPLAYMFTCALLFVLGAYMLNTNKKTRMQDILYGLSAPGLKHQAVYVKGFLFI